MSKENVYSEKARQLFAQLNLSPTGASTPAARAHYGYNDLDPVWQHPGTKARVFIGNVTASGTRATLVKNDITCIVNCTDDLKNAFEEDIKDSKNLKKDPPITYFRFDIYKCFSLDLSKDEDVIKFWAPVLHFIDACTEQGRNVLIHCLAGAHRAGTTGCAYVLYAAKMDRETAVQACKLCRPIVAPDGELERALDRLEGALKRMGLPPPENVTTLPPTRTRRSSTCVAS